MSLRYNNNNNNQKTVAVIIISTILEILVFKTAEISIVEATLEQNPTKQFYVNRTLEKIIWKITHFYG
jgi:cell shape-determining protein MreD